ncbi:DNA-binding transcriptional response regulator [Pseudomonas botevensis]|uniref:response regulator n=1 Tax=Pseudomonas botevensis TaxID=2842352 RepID=UPI001C3CB64C|nr:response regulator [Pseudomonas botevensis]MBV4475241.1 response regulator [Pseudomonas botevensis]
MNVSWEGMLPIPGEIIVVEDDPVLSDLMGDIIIEIGGLPKVFQTADDALTYMLESQLPCPLIVVDQGLPGQLKGIEFITMVESKWPSVKSILSSGYALDPTSIPHSTIYLHKPWSLEDLVISVATLLQPGHPIKRTGPSNAPAL